MYFFVEKCRKICIFIFIFFRFENVHAKARYEYICELLLESKADVICLQEVTYSFINHLKEYTALNDLYSCSDADFKADTVNPYGVLTLCKKELDAKYEWHEFPTLMMRQLLVASFTRDSSAFAVGNVHLESLSTQPVREKQLNICKEILESDKFNSLLVGDFNFDSYINWGYREGRLDNECLMEIIPEWKDTWQVCHDTTKEKGYTYDTTLNKMLKQKRKEQMRYDRIMCHLNEQWVPNEINLFAHEEIPRSGIDSWWCSNAIFPSDHFGLIATFHKMK